MLELFFPQPILPRVRVNLHANFGRAREFGRDSPAAASKALSRRSAISGRFAFKEDYGPTAHHLTAAPFPSRARAMGATSSANRSVFAAPRKSANRVAELNYTGKSVARANLYGEQRANRRRWVSGRTALTLEGGRPVNDEELLERTLTTAEVAEMLRVHPSTIYRLLKRGELPGFRIGDCWRISMETLEMWLYKKSNIGI
jgi:excisionase family DNA binding protein